MALLAAAYDADLFAFCDQDDIWLPDKLARAAHALAGVPQGQPALYCSRQILVDARLKPLGHSPGLRHAPNFRNALTQNIASGCTLVLNAAARAAILAFPIPHGVLHDWWSYLAVSGVGGRVIFDPTPAILYRQHSCSAVGASASVSARAMAAVRRGPFPFMALLAVHLDGLEQRPDRLSADALAVIADCRALGSRFALQRLGSLVRAGLRRQGLAENILLFLWILAARLPRAGSTEARQHTLLGIPERQAPLVSNQPH